jgi:SAM-dependent methyltransferase
MNSPRMSSSESSSLKLDTIFGLVMAVIGVVILLLASRLGDWQDKAWDFGMGMIFIGTPLIFWRLFLNLADLRLVSILTLMRKENLEMVIKDKLRSKKIITDSIYEWAQDQKEGTLKLKGVTLNLVFGNNGVLNEVIEKNRLVNRDQKKIEVLLLNPYSMNAITRSIQEKRPFEEETDTVKAICAYTLDQHMRYTLYDDFKQSSNNIKDLIKNKSRYKIAMECRVYSTASPSFLLVNKRRAISENLILGKKKNDPEGKLYGLLPHFIYGNGEIKDSLESHFDYIWRYDSIPLEDFHEEVEEKHYEINRLFMLYSLQKEIWERQWKEKGRSLISEYDILYQVYKELYPNLSPRRILDLGCGDGGGGSLTVLEENPNAKFDLVDIAETAIKYFKENITIVEQRKQVNYHVTLNANDMLTFLNRCEPLQYSLVYANFSIIYMTKIKAIEIYRKIFEVMHGGGIFALSLWTTCYFDMPIGAHGEEGKRPAHTFVRIPMTEDLRVLSGGSRLRIGEIRRFYRGFDELMEEFRSADEHSVMDFENIQHSTYENGAILRVWVGKK